MLVTGYFLLDLEQYLAMNISCSICTLAAPCSNFGHKNWRLTFILAHMRIELATIMITGMKKPRIKMYQEYEVYCGSKKAGLQLKKAKMEVCHEMSKRTLVNIIILWGCLHATVIKLRKSRNFTWGWANYNIFQRANSLNKDIDYWIRQRFFPTGKTPKKKNKWLKKSTYFMTMHRRPNFH